MRVTRTSPILLRLELIAAAGVLVLAGRAAAGPDWQEGFMGTGDAGDLPGSAQTPDGVGQLTRIIGTLNGQGVFAGDFQDMYLISIPVPAAFSASTVSPLGFTGFDSQLWLFDASGFGLLGVDGPAAEAFLGPVATDGSGSMIPGPGLYLLAISSVDSDPLDAGAFPIFDQLSVGEISGPDGPGGASPIAGWTPGLVGGDYTIFLTGAFFVPGPGAAGMFIIGAVAGRSRRRR